MTTDPQLVAACLEGEQEAWELLVRRYAGLVYSVPRRFGLNDDDSADVFQGTWSALWEQLGDIRDRSRLGPWLLTVASRLSYQIIQRRRLLALGPAEEAESEPDLDVSTQPEVQALARDEAEAVRWALTCLPERCRRLLEYLFFAPDAPSYAEVARRIGVAEDSIGSMRARCLRHLRMLLVEAGHF